MMEISLRHVGIYVNNLDEEINFYESVFHVEQITRHFEYGNVTDTMFGESDVKIDVYKGRFPNGGILELICHIRGDNSIKTGKIYDIGRSHIAIMVFDAEKINREIVNRGGKIISSPVISADNKVKVFFASDLEDNYLEIVEEIK